MATSRKYTASHGPSLAIMLVAVAVALATLAGTSSAQVVSLLPATVTNYCKVDITATFSADRVAGTLPVTPTESDVIPAGDFRPAPMNSIGAASPNQYATIRLLDSSRNVREVYVASLRELFSGLNPYLNTVGLGGVVFEVFELCNSDKNRGGFITLRATGKYLPASAPFSRYAGEIRVAMST